MNDFMDAVQEMPQASAAPATETAPQPDLESLVREAVAHAVAEKFSAFQAENAKTQNALEDREDAVSARENALFEREMRSFAREQLLKRKLPEALLDALCCKSEEKCLESLDKVEKAFRTAVQEGVVERMRGTEPVRSDSQPLDTMDDNAYYHATYVK